MSPLTSWRTPTRVFAPSSSVIARGSPRDHLVAGGLLHWDGLSGDDRLVDFAFAAAHGGIRRHTLAGAHEQQVALAQIGNRHFVDSSPARSESCAIYCPE